MPQFAFAWSGGRLSHEVTPEQLTEPALGAHLCAVHNVPAHAAAELRRQLDAFRWAAQQPMTTAQTVVEGAHGLTESDLQAALDVLADEPASAKLDKSSSGDPFVDAFCHMLVCPFPDTISSVLSKQRMMAKEVGELLRARDWELDRLRREHEQLMSSVSDQLNRAHDDDEQRQLSHSASSHFETMQTVEANYSSQLCALNEAQRREYRAFVCALHEQVNARHASLQQLDASEPVPAAASPPAALSPALPVLDESFTIYLGAQLKSMHNLRVTAADALSLCHKTRSSAHDHGESMNQALNLYSPRLTGVVLLSAARPMHHVNLHTPFSRACEQSTELHFDALDAQLQAVEAQISRVRSGSGGTDSLVTGDVYVTKHSNLSRAQVVFHLVGDDALQSDINSRHACINGLRNVIRLSARFGVTTIALPLLLVDKLTEDMTINWCLRRAELVFKCVKGFLMEVASVGSATHKDGQQQHYTVQFLLPAATAEHTFTQIAHMLPTLFHLVKPVVAE